MPALFLVSFCVSFFSIKYLMRLLPKDQGREFAVNGKLSEGKPRGAGVIMITAFVLCAVLFVPFDAEMGINMALIYAAMLTGFFDDAAKTPWGELKKGLLDLAITAGVTHVPPRHDHNDIQRGVQNAARRVRDTLRGAGVDKHKRHQLLRRR